MAGWIRSVRVRCVCSNWLLLLHFRGVWLDWAAVKLPAVSRANKTANLQLAFAAAERHLQLPPLLDAAAMAAAARVGYDAKSVMAYVGELQVSCSVQSATIDAWLS